MDDEHLDNTADRYAAFFEKVELVIVRLLKYAGITVDAQRTGRFHHRYHESVLEKLANADNVLHTTLGSGPVYQALRHVKTFRNRYTKRVPGSRDFALVLDAPGIEARTNALASPLTTCCNHMRAAVRENHMESTFKLLLQDRAARDQQYVGNNVLGCRQRLQERELKLFEALNAVKSDFVLSGLDHGGFRLVETQLIRHRRALLHMSNASVSLLQEIFEDVSTVFGQLPKDGRARQEMLVRFVIPRLDERRQEATDPFCMRIEGLANNFLDFIRTTTTELTELQTVNRDLKLTVAQSTALLSVKVLEARETSKQVTKQGQEITDLKAKLERITNMHDDAQSCNDTLQAENQSLRRQLEAERTSYGFRRALLQTL